MALIPTPPSGVPLFNPVTGTIDVLWQNYFNALATISGGFAPLDARYWVSTPNSDLTNETNLGALSSGYLKLTTAAGVGTPSTVTTIPGSDITGAALTKTDDTNVTLTLGGTPTTALLRAASLTLGWTGALGLARGGTHADLSATGGTGQVLKQSTVGGNVSVATIAASEIASGAALTKTDDTNVTLSLGGSPTTALLAAASLTLGWTSTLAVSRGGLGVGTLASNGVLYGNSTSAVQALAVNSTATNKFLTQVSSGTPAWNVLVAGDVPNLPASIITSGQLALARGGTNADLSSTGGTSQFVRQSSTGAAFTVSQPSCSDLSDYASGTWTPSDGSGAGLSITNTYTGQYVRVGNVVYVSMGIVYPATGSGTASLIAGLPFGSIAVQSGMNIFYSSYGDVLYCLINASATTLAFYDKNGGALTNANLSGKTIRASGSYKI